MASTPTTNRPRGTRPAPPVVGSATSADGTAIAYERRGSGPALVLVDGALCFRDFGPTRTLATHLGERFTVHQYDRRGRGDSGAGSTPYRPDLEVEDLAAIVAAAGGDVILLGLSSGAVLALDAANRVAGVRALVCWEPPLVVDPDGNVQPDDLLPRITTAVADGDRSTAVRLFMRHVGTPRMAVAVMRRLPLWRKLTAVAHTLPYDLTILEGLRKGTDLPEGRWRDVGVPTLVMHGSKSPGGMGRGVAALDGLLPTSTHRVLDGQTHMVRPAPLSAAVVEFAASLPGAAA